MHQFPTVRDIAHAVNKANSISLAPVPQKQILLSGRMPDGSKLILMSPWSKALSRSYSHWIDITEQQKVVMDSFDHHIVIFRLESGKICLIDWSILSALFTEKYMRNSSKAGNHLKLHFYQQYIRVYGPNDNTINLPAEMQDFSEVDLNIFRIE